MGCDNFPDPAVRGHTGKLERGRSQFLFLDPFARFYFTILLTMSLTLHDLERKSPHRLGSWSPLHTHI